MVAQDAFYTETTELADVVLPAATWGESEGTTTNMERTISRVRPATEVPSGARPDLDISATIGARLFDGLFESTSPDPAAIFDEFASLTAGTVADCSGISYVRLEEDHAVRWPAPDAESHGGYRYYEGDAALDDSTTSEFWSFSTDTGLAQFSTGRQRSLPEPVDDDYPLTLTTAREADGYNTGVRSRGGEPGPLIARIHPDTVAAHSDLVEDDRIAVATRRGTVSAQIDPDEGIPSGMVWLPIHHPETNRLTLSDRDPQSKEPHFKQCAVRQRVPADEVPGMIKNIVEAYAALRSEGQTFREWVDATGHETIVELAEPHEVEGYEDPCLTDGKQSWYPFDDGESPAPTAADRTPLSADD